MGYLEKMRGIIRNTITATVPAAVWTGLRDGIAAAYREAHDAAENDPRILPEEARFKAAQDRHLFVEYTLAKVARETGATFESAIVEANGWRFGQFRINRVSFTQKCVGSLGEEPPAAKFREHLAASNAFVRQTRFAFLSDAMAQASEVEITGILIHAPESRQFSDPGFLKPSFMCLAVPLGDYSGWAAKFELPELIASYQAQQIKRKAPKPKWKGQDKKAVEESA